MQMYVRTYVTFYAVKMAIVISVKSKMKSVKKTYWKNRRELIFFKDHTDVYHIFLMTAYLCYTIFCTVFARFLTSLRSFLLILLLHFLCF